MIHCNESIKEFWKKEKKLLAENFQLNKIIIQIYTLLQWKKMQLEIYNNTNKYIFDIQRVK